MAYEVNGGVFIPRRTLWRRATDGNLKARKVVIKTARYLGWLNGDPSQGTIDFPA